MCLWVNCITNVKVKDVLLHSFETEEIAFSLNLTLAFNNFKISYITRNV